MARKRNGEIGGYVAWQARFLETGEVPPDGLDVNGLEVTAWQYHGGRGCDPVRQAWAACRDTLLPAWIEHHPGSRPYGWWCFESGLERHTGGIKLRDGRVLGKNVMYSIRDSIPADQRAWLAERGLLQPGE